MNKHIKQTNRYLATRRGTQGLLCGAALLVAPLAFAQDADEEEEIFELSPFTVEGSEDTGYRATSTMAGSRIRTDLKDVGSAISVITEEFLRDTGATDNQSLLQYTTNTEVGGIGGNFAGDERLGLLNPSANTRVRGLSSADNTRDYFLTDIPWDGYNVNRVDLQRGPNAILSGLGSPAGIINNTTDNAVFANEGEVQLRFGSYGSTRMHFNVNRMLLEDELAVRVAAVKSDNKFRQEEAWSEDERAFVAFKYEPKFLKTENAATTLTANFEDGSISSNNPRTRPPVDRLSGFWQSANGLPAQITAHPLAFYGNQALNGDVRDASQYPPLYVGGQRVHLNPAHINAAVIMDDVTDDDGNVIGQEQRRDLDGNLAYELIGLTGNPLSGAYFNNISFNHPWYGENYTDGPVLYFGGADQGNGNPTYLTVPGMFSSDNNVLDVVDGRVVRDLGGTGMTYHKGIVSTVGLGQAARNLGLYLSDFGGWGDQLIYDRSIFDYRNHLIDGDNKREWQNFDVYNVKLQQTLWNNRVGLEGAINEETYNYGQTSPFGWSPGITIDVNSHLADFSENPNEGRPVIFQRTQGASSDNERARESYRVTAFAELREGDIFDTDSFLGRLLGKQRLTGLMSGDDITFYEMGFKNWLVDDAYRTYQGTAGLAQNESEVMAAVYLGPSVIGTSGASGLNLQPVPKLNPKGATSIRYWDSYWADPSTMNVDGVSAPWWNPWDDSETTQANNPENYVGWRNMPVNMLVDTEGDRMDLITTARSKTEEVTSEAFVWQGFFWDGAVVGLYGWRKDEVLQYNVTAPRKETTPVPGYFTAANGPQQGHFNRNIFDPTGATPFPETGGSYRNYTPADAQAQAAAKLGGVNRYEDTNESKSLVVHLDRFLPELPWASKLSVFWNESSNFQPAETRVDHMNQTLSPPSGDTEDYGLVLSTFRDKLSFKVNFYESTVYDESYDPTGGALWYVGTAETSLFAAGMRDKAFLDGVPGWSDAWRGYANYPYEVGNAPWEAWWADNHPGEPIRNQTKEEAQAWQERALANLEENLAPQEFWDAWGATKSDARWQNGWWDPWSESTGAQPAGFTSTADVTSKGTEYELTWNPSENWNIAFNAAKTEAVRNNLAGSLKEWVAARNAVHNGDNGDIRLWWSGDRNNTLKTRWNNEFYSKYQLALQQEGQAVDELREWRFNLISNYTFRDGAFKGLNVGGAYRWEDEVGIGYPQSAGVTEEGNRVVVYDIANPYFGPSEDHLDLWAGYQIDLTDSVQWRIQLNVRDVLADGSLIPLSVQPDGSIREYRLTGDPTWFLTNTFTF